MLTDVDCCQNQGGSSHSGPTPLRRCDARGLCVSESLREPGRDHEVCREIAAMETVDASEELRGLAEL